MTDREIALVRESFALVRPIAEPAAMLFYGRLFQLDPSLRPMFKRDLTEQGRLLTHIIAIAVTNLDRIELLAPALRDLGRRHKGYGVKARHYDTVAEALLWTLEQELGDAFTPDVRDAWVQVYGLLAKTMQDGAMPCAA